MNEVYIFQFMITCVMKVSDLAFCVKKLETEIKIYIVIIFNLKLCAKVCWNWAAGNVNLILKLKFS